MSFINKAWRLCRAWRQDLRAAAAKYFVTREVIKVLALTHAQELVDTPRNEWHIVKQRQVEEIQAVRDGRQFDIVDRRSWAFPFLPECLSEDSQILTGDGFKGKDEISKRDLIATLNPTTGELEYFHPERIIRRQYSGPMLLFKGRGFDHLVTPNHDMVGRWFWKNYDRGGKKKPWLQSGNIDRVVDRVEGVRAYSAFSRVPAKQIRESGWRGDYGFQVPFGAKWTGSFPDFYDARTDKITLKCKYEWETRDWWEGKKNDYRGFKIDLKDFMRFLGIYIAEGRCAGNCKGIESKSHLPRFVQAIAAASDNTVYDRSAGYNVGVAQLPTSKYFHQIEKMLLRLPLGFERDNNGNGWHSNSRTLHSWVFECGNTYTKHIPQWVKDLPPEYLKILIRWYAKGDGTIAPNSGGARWCYTTSQKLSEDLQEVFLKIGRQAKVTKTDGSAAALYFGHDPARCAPKYTIEENLGRFRSLPRPTEVSYTGCVWCVDILP